MKHTKELARWLATLKYSDLPATVVDFTKRFILDDLGCMVGGALQLGNKSVMRDIMSLDEKPESTAVYYGYKTSAASAALLNGSFIAGFDYDSMTDSGGGHMGSQTAALLALGEREMVPGHELIAAECAGIEAQCRAGVATQIKHHGIGGGGAYPWHSNCAQGPLAAAVTAGRILGLSPDAMEHALAIAASNVGGNYQHYFTWGSSVKRVRCGIGAWSGVQAALLAAEGVKGPAGALDGEGGWCEAMAGRNDRGEKWFDAAILTRNLGTEWHLLTHNTKAGGCGCVTTLLCPVLTAVALRDKHSPDPADIVDVMVEFKDEYGLQQGAQIVGDAMGDTPEQRLGSSGWSLQWMVAEALVVGIPGMREQLNNIKPNGRYREIETLAEKVRGRANPAYYEEHFGKRPHHRYGGRVLVTMKDGTVYDQEPVPYPGCRLVGADGPVMFHGGSINVITPEQLEDKFREQAKVVGFTDAEQDAIIRLVNALEEQHDILELVRRLVPAKINGRSR